MDPDRPNSSRRKRPNAADEASMTLTKPIANWQAKFAWACASWGLIPVAGLALGTVAVVFGAAGWARVLRQPDDLGVRHAIGSMLLGSVEIAVNTIGTLLVIKGVLQLSQ